MCVRSTREEEELVFCELSGGVNEDHERMHVQLGRLATLEVGGYIMAHKFGHRFETFSVCDDAQLTHVLSRDLTDTRAKWVRVDECCQTTAI